MPLNTVFRNDCVKTAALVDPTSLHKVDIKRLGESDGCRNGGTRPCIKCSAGAFAGKFFFLGPDRAEILGSSSEKTSNTTLCLETENEDIAPVHCEVSLPPPESASVIACCIRDLSPSPAYGVFVKLRAIKKAILTEGQVIWMEILKPANLSGLLAFGVETQSTSSNAPKGAGTQNTAKLNSNSKTSNGYPTVSIYGKKGSPKGEGIRIHRGDKLSVEQAFEDFLSVYELEGIFREFIKISVSNNDANVHDKFATFQSLIVSDFFESRLKAESLENLVKFKLAVKEFPHYLPWEEKSRPLRLISDSTGEVLGEIRWTGCYLIPCGAKSASSTRFGQRSDPVLQKNENAIDFATRHFTNVKEEILPRERAASFHLATPDQPSSARATEFGDAMLPKHTLPGPPRTSAALPSQRSVPATSGKAAYPSSSSSCPNQTFSPLRAISNWFAQSGSEPISNISRHSLPPTLLSKFGQVPSETPELKRSSSTGCVLNSGVNPPHLRRIDNNTTPAYCWESNENESRSWWTHCFLDSNDLEVNAQKHPLCPVPYKIPSLASPSIWSCEAYLRNKAMGLPLQATMLPRKDRESMPTLLSRCKSWLQRTPEQCLTEGMKPQTRPMIRLPPSFGSGFHLTVRYQGGNFILFETFPAQSADFSFCSTAERSASYQAFLDNNFETVIDRRGFHQIVDQVDCVWLKLAPQTESHSLRYGDTFRLGSLSFDVLRFNVGYGSLQGYRASMEDEEVGFQDLGLSELFPVSLFAIYDGHGGRDCATFLREELHLFFMHQLHILVGDIDSAENLNAAIFEALYRSFIFCDRAFLKMQWSQVKATGIKNGPGGAAVLVVLCGNIIWCANAGDARCVLCRDGRAIQLSVDHKPDRPDELDRINKSDGFVKNRRVLGRLAVSRAFGDIEYKNVDTESPALVIVDPEVRYIERVHPDDEFLLLACDGLFDVYSSNEVVDILRNKLKQMPAGHLDGQRLVETIVQESIELRCSKDNVSAILILFKHVI